jgi:4-hydroxy-3-polyprenylbenzoate decarboxylase
MTAPRDLRELLAALERAGELQRVAATADPQLEIAAIVDRVCKGPGGGPALYFERPADYAAPVLANLFGSPRRLARALGVAGLDDLGTRLGAALAAAGAGEPSGDGFQRLARLLAAPRWQPRLLPDGPCREVRGDAALLRAIPALHAWPGDGGRYLTLPLVFTSHPDSGEVNCGMYRLQFYADDTLGLHLAPGADAARHLAAWAQRNEAMPVAVALGGPPALLFAAGLPLPPGVAETALAGWLQGAALEMVACAGSGLAVPALAEYVIEGEIRPGESRPEGPFGNHSGRYVLAAPAPLLRVRRIGRRRRPLYPCTVVGPPPMEDCWLAKAAERLLLPLLQTDIPEVVDWNLPLATIFHSAALVAARVPEGGGAALLARLRRHPLLARARLLVLFDAHVDVQDAAGCYWRAVNGADPGRDLHIAESRLAIDATGSDPAQEVGADAATGKRLDARWAELGLDDLG